MNRGIRFTVIPLLAMLAGSALAQPSGKATYDQKCAMCHGLNGVAKPMGKGSRNFNDPAYDVAVEEIVKVTLEGKGKMPKMAGKLTQEEATLVAEYVRSLRPAK